jgi:hypothetical protein
MSARVLLADAIAISRKQQNVPASTIKVQPKVEDSRKQEESAAYSGWQKRATASKSGCLSFFG